MPDDVVVMTVRVSKSLAAELDKYAAVHGFKRSECLRALLSESLLRESEGPYVPLIRQAVRQELGLFEEKMTERMLSALDARLEEIEGEAAVANGELLRMVGALLWFSSFDEHRDEGGAMDAWLRLALMKSEIVLSGDHLDDFDPTVGAN